SVSEDTRGSTRVSRYSRKREGQQNRSGGDSDKLFAAGFVRHGRPLHADVRVVVPKRLTVALVYRDKRAVGIAVEDDSAGRCQNTRPGLEDHRPALSNFPLDLAAVDIDGTQISLGRNGTRVGRPGRMARLQRHQIVKPGGRAICGRTPVSPIVRALPLLAQQGCGWLGQLWTSIGTDPRGP